MAVRHIEASDLGWVAGLLEGEGCFYLKRGLFAEVSLQMTDEDVVRRLHRIVGAGRVNGPYWPNASCKKGQWRWTLTRRAEVPVFLAAIRPLMGARRGQKIDECLAIVPRPPGRPRALECTSGHSMVEGDPNVYVSPSGHRHCITCYRDRTGTSLRPSQRVAS